MGITSLIETESDNHTLIPDQDQKHAGYFSLQSLQQTEPVRQNTAPTRHTQPTMDATPQYNTGEGPVENPEEKYHLELPPPVISQEELERETWWGLSPEDQRKINADLLMGKIYETVGNSEVQDRLNELRDNEGGRGLVIHSQSGKQGWRGGWTRTAVLFPDQTIVAGDYADARGYTNERPTYKLVTPEENEVDAGTPLTEDGRTFIEITEKPAGKVTYKEAAEYMLSGEDGNWRQYLHDYPQYRSKLMELQAQSEEAIQEDINDPKHIENWFFIKNQINKARDRLQDTRYRRVLYSEFSREDGRFSTTGFPKDTESYYDQNLRESLNRRIITG